MTTTTGKRKREAGDTGDVVRSAKRTHPHSFLVHLPRELLVTVLAYATSHSDSAATLTSLLTLRSKPVLRALFMLLTSPCENSPGRVLALSSIYDKKNCADALFFLGVLAKSVEVVRLAQLDAVSPAPFLVGLSSPFSLFENPDSERGPVSFSYGDPDLTVQPAGRHARPLVPTTFTLSEEEVAATSKDPPTPTLAGRLSATPHPGKLGAHAVVLAPQCPLVRVCLDGRPERQRALFDHIEAHVVGGAAGRVDLGKHAPSSARFFLHLITSATTYASGRDMKVFPGLFMPSSYTVTPSTAAHPRRNMLFFECGRTQSRMSVCVEEAATETDGGAFAVRADFSTNAMYVQMMRAFVRHCPPVCTLTLVHSDIQTREQVRHLAEFVEYSQASVHTLPSEDGMGPRTIVVRVHVDGKETLRANEEVCQSIKRVYAAPGRTVLPVALFPSAQ